jgi:hypothetical protein
MSVAQQPDVDTVHQPVAFEMPDGSALAAGAVAAQTTPAPRKPRARRRRQEEEHEPT